MNAWRSAAFNELGNIKQANAYQDRARELSVILNNQLK